MKHGNDTRENIRKLRLLRLLCAYSVFMLMLFALLIVFLEKRSITKIKTEQLISEPTTEYILVRADGDSEGDIVQPEETPVRYTVREHMGRIGVFSEEGKLVSVIDVYVKTLPEADRRMLGEGFEIIGQDQLNALIQDYDS